MENPHNEPFDDRLGGLFDPNLANVTLRILVEAFEETFGDSFDEKVTVGSDSISAPTTLDGFPCIQTISVGVADVTSVSAFDGDEVMLGFLYSRLSDLLDAEFGRWPSIDSFCGGWIKGSVTAELKGLGVPGDPLILLVRYARLGGRAFFH